MGLRWPLRFYLNTSLRLLDGDGVLESGRGTTGRHKLAPE